MDKKELMDKFCTLYAEVERSEDKEDIKVTMCMFKKCLEMLTDVSMRSASELVECYEGNLKYYNFMTEMEAEEVVSRFVNQDGSKGPHWRDHDALFAKVEEHEGKTECEPHYNKWALYVAMNKFASDQNNVITKWVDGDSEKYFEACYDLAVSQLKDKDRLCWIRPYYSLSK